MGIDIYIGIDINMGLLDFLFKSKKEREQDARIKDVLDRADATIERIEKGLEEMQKDDKRWSM